MELKEAIRNGFEIKVKEEITYETKTIGRLEYFTNQFSVLWFYLSQIFFPVKLATDYNHWNHSNFLHPEIVVSGIGLLGLIIFSIIY